MNYETIAQLATLVSAALAAYLMFDSVGRETKDKVVRYALAVCFLLVAISFYLN